MAQLKDLLVSGAARFLNGVFITNASSADDINPNITNTYQLGTTDLKWKNIYSTTFTGYLDGNAKTTTGANIITTVNGVAKYSDTIGTFANSNVIIDANNNLIVPNSIYLTTTATRSASNQSLFINGWQAVTGYDTWLRLNSENKFTSGIYTPGGLRVEGTTQVRTLNHINTNYVTDGSWVTGTTGTAGNGTSAGTQGTNIFSLGNATAIDSSESSSGAADGTKTGANNSRGIFRIYGTKTGYVEEIYDNVALQSSKPFCILTGNKMTISAGKVSGLGAQQTRMYSDGIAISNPATANDVGWMRVTGTGESDTIYEIATGDDGGTGESIVSRQYNTSSAVAHETTIMDHTGSFIFNSGATPTTNTTNLFTINGHLVINPAYNTNNDYSEGIRINLGSNNWSTIALGGASTSTTGTEAGIWLVGVNHGGTTDAPTGTFYISHNGSDSATTRLQGSENGFIAYPRFGINGENTTYNFYVNGTSYFEGNTIHNGIIYLANGTTYYIDNSANAILMSLKIGDSTQLASNYGGTVTPIYWNNSTGLPTAFTTTVGSATKPVYMNAGAITVGTYELNATVNGYSSTDTTKTASYGVAYYSQDKKEIKSTSTGTSEYLLQGNGNAAPSWIQATSSNTASTIVKRDASGNFSAGTITAALSGNATTATTADKVANSLSINGKSFNGSSAVDAGVISIQYGGTGASTAAGARTNLGITLANLGAAASSHTHSYLPLSGGTMTGNINMGTTSTTNSPTIIFTSNKRNNVWMGYANDNGSWYLWDSANNKNIITSDSSGDNTFTGSLLGNASTATLLQNRGTNCTASNGLWNNSRGGTIVWGQGWSSTNYTYTPSGGSATTITDTGNVSFYVKAGSTTSNSLTANMAIDGEIYAGGGFIGNASSASILSFSGTITAVSGTSRYSTGLKFGRIYSSGYPFNYGTTITMETGSFGAELAFNGLGGGGATGSGDMRFRTHSDWSTSEWGDWRTVLDTSNYTSYCATASHTHSYLPLSGGTVTGDITRKCSSIDVTLTNNNVSSTQYPAFGTLIDVNNKTFARLEGIIYSTGNVGSYWYLRNYDTSGNMMGQKGISLTMDKSGNLTVSTSGVIKSTQEIQSSAANFFRSTYGSTSVMFRNDGTNFWILLSNSDETGNNWITPTGGNHPLWINLTTGYVYTTRLYGAVWNDYAEYRNSSNIKPGYCAVETGMGNLVISTARLQPGANIVSDTYGFAIGETNKTKTPIAVSGRVLAYPYEDKYSYKAGDPVCSGPNGTISKMTREEVKEYPDRIIGTVSEIPDYDVWGTGKVKVNGRIWIKVK